MPGECFVTSLIILVLSISCFRAKRKNWGFAVLPLGLVPFVAGIGMYIVGIMFKNGYDVIIPGILIIVSLVASCIWIGIASTILIKTKKLRIPYLGVSIAFDIILSIILLCRYYC